MVGVSALSLGGWQFKLWPSHTKVFKNGTSSFLAYKGQSTDEPHRLESMGKTRFLHNCPTEYGEKSDIIKMALLASRVLWKVM